MDKDISFFPRLELNEFDTSTSRGLCVGLDFLGTLSQTIRPSSQVPQSPIFVENWGTNKVRIFCPLSSQWTSWISEQSDFEWAQKEARWCQRPMGTTPPWNIMVISHHPHLTTKETLFTMVYEADNMLPVEIDTPHGDAPNSTKSWTM